MKKSAAFHDHFKAWLDEESSRVENLDIEAEAAFINFAQAHAVTPPEQLKLNILQKIKSLNASSGSQQTLDINALPILDASSNWLDWQACVQHITLPEDFESVFLHPLEVSPKRDLFIAWVKEFIEEEVHDDLVESFMILEGSCECTILKDDELTRVRLTVGDFIEIPVGVSHNILITSPQPVKAILQWNRLMAV